MKKDIALMQPRFQSTELMVDFHRQLKTDWLCW